MSERKSPPTREAPPPKPRRFYKQVSVSEAAPFRVLLDGRPVMTPLRCALETPHGALAEAVAAEWQAQRESIDPETMPLTRLMSTALDRVAVERAAIVAGLLPYAETDLLCYRAPHPADLKARQAAVWQPILDWLEAEHGVGLSVVDGIVPIAQPASVAAAMDRIMAHLSVEELTALQAAVAATGSLALGLALIHGRIDATAATAATHLDETYQNEQWGEDAEAIRRRYRIAADIAAAETYLILVRRSAIPDPG